MTCDSRAQGILMSLARRSAVIPERSFFTLRELCATSFAWRLVLVRKNAILILLCLSLRSGHTYHKASTGTGSQTVTFEKLGVRTTDQPITNRAGS